ncbi:M48 family metallopeptidase [Aquipseudomonas campi]
MNFFEHQDRAKRNSGRLLLLMALAVLSLIALTSLALIVIFNLNDSRAYGVANGQLIFGVSVVVVGVVLIGSLYKSIQLARGGKVVAERLGGRLINLEPQGLAERRVLNVVEEMAIASGTPVPSVYVLDDPAINAFAAGLSPQDAVIGITSGALNLLTREELQGVIAHEFSHIFNGDMRLNLRLVAVLHGILMIGLIGQFMLRHMGGTRTSNSKRDGGVAAFFMAGLALMVLGYAGTFFGNLIKAAVSRQREFLADASAVQFTRNPESIGGALKKIGGHMGGSQLQAEHASEFSHLYFSAGISQALDGMMATHPPLNERIRRVEPGWDGRYPNVNAQLSVEPTASASTDSDWQHQWQGVAALSGFSAAAAEHSIATIGDPQPAHLAQARNSLQRLPDELKEAAHDRSAAQALLYALLLDRSEATREGQLQHLRGTVSDRILASTQALQPKAQALDPGQRLPLLELAIPALKQLTKGEYSVLKANLVALIKADGKVELLEWTLLRIVERNVEGLRPVQGKYHLVELSEEIRLLLSALAHAGHDDPAQAQQAFTAACATLPLGDLQLAERGTGLKGLDAGLARLSHMWPLQKPRLLKAMAVCVGHDGRISVAEAELMRAVADMLDCPMPPLLAA